MTTHKPVINADGSQHWYRDDKRHRDDGPAIIFADGSQHWYRDDKLHQDDGPAIIEANGSQYWYRDGKLHRDDGPAVIYTESQHWYRDGEEIITAELEFIPNQPVVLVFGPASGYGIFGGVRDGLKIVFPSEESVVLWRLSIY